TPDTPITPVPAGVALPPARVNHAAHLDWIGHAVASLDDGLRFLSGTLEGAETMRGDDDEFALGAHWAELEWPNEGRIRLFSPSSDASPLAHWLNGRRGGIHHLAVSLEEPAAVHDTIGRGEGVWEVIPDDNLGMRLFLTQRQA